MQNWVFFLCSLDNLLLKNVINLLLKNVIVFFLGNQISKWRSFEKKGAILTYFSHFLVTRESYKSSFSTYLTHIHTCILLTLLTFLALPILKKKKKKYEFIRYGFSLVWVLLLIIYSRHFGTIIN